MAFNETLENIIAHISSGSIEKGLDDLKELEQNVTDEQKFMLAETYVELGHLERAHQLLDELLERYPNEGELLALKAELLIDEGKEDEALETLWKISEDDDAYLRGQLLLADLYEWQGLGEVAEQRLLSAYKKRSDEPLFIYAIGQFYLQRGDYYKSIPFFKKSYHSEEIVHAHDVALSLAEAYSGAGQFEEALPFYEEGLAEQLDLNHLFSYGYTAYQLENYPLAITQFERLLELDPDYTSVYVYLAKGYEAQDDVKAARTVIEKGLKKDEYNEELYLIGGKCALKDGDPREAERLLTTLFSLNPSHVEGLRTLAAVLKREERYEEMLELLSNAKQFGEEDPLCQWFSATAHWQLEQFQQAREQFERANAYFHDDANFLEEYGEFLLEEGEQKRAVELFAKSYELDREKIHLVEFIERLNNEEHFF